MQEAQGLRSPYKLDWEERVQLEEYKMEMEKKEREEAAAALAAKTEELK